MASQNAESTIDMEPKTDEKVPEIIVIRKNPTSMKLIIDISSYLENLAKNENMKGRLPMIQEKVYQVNDPMQMKLYLISCGKHLQQVGKFRDSIRFLEAAHGVEVETAADDVQGEIIQLLNKAYDITGQFRAEMSVLCWEMDLFGTNDSRTVSCESKNGKLIAKRDFDRGDVLFIDKPVVGYVQDSKLQCNACMLKTLYSIICMKCCAVFYCSVECQRNDEHYHKYECRGFQLQYFFLMKNVLALRMVVKALDVLQQNLLLRQHSLGRPETPQQLWDVLLEKHPHSADFLQVFEACTCENFTTDRKVYHTALQTVPQILLYIMEDKQLLVDYKHCWMGLTADLRNTFLESVLLRVLFLTETQACCFKYELAFDKTEYDEMLQATGSASLDDKSISESDVTKENQFYGLYRFQTEMKSSRIQYNTIASLLDHGAVVFRAAEVIKKDDTLIFMKGLLLETAPLSLISKIDSKITVIPLFNNPHYTKKMKLMDQIAIWFHLVKDEAQIFTADHFNSLLVLFDQFTAKYQVLPKRPESIIMLYDATNMLDKIYHEARLTPMVLMRDDWMMRLMFRYVRFRVIKRENTGNFINYMYKRFFLE